MRTPEWKGRTVSLDGAYLKPLSKIDVTVGYVDGLNDPEVKVFLVGPRERTQTTESVEQYVEFNERDPRSVLFGLYVDDVLRGTVRLHDVELSSGTAWLGIALFDKTVWRRGWASTCVNAVAEFAADIGVRRLFAGVEKENLASRRLFERCGFSEQPADADAASTTWVKDLAASET